MSDGSADRRIFPRSGTDQHGIVSARVRPGHRVAVIDMSRGGALIEGANRLLPGAAVDLQVETLHGRSTVRGRVLRCAVTRLRSSSVSYRAAIAFDRHLSPVVHDRTAGYQEPVGQPSAVHDLRVDPTPDLAR